MTGEMAPTESGTQTAVDPELRDYEGLFLRWKQLFDRAHHGKTVVRLDEIPVIHSRMGVSQFYLMPQFEELALSHWVVFVRDLRSQNGRHLHQGGIAIFILEGRGFTVVNGRRVDWEAGDVVYLPLVKGGLDHQHFSLPGEAAKFMGIVYEPLIVALGAEMTQLAPRGTDEAQGDVAFEEDPDAPPDVDAWAGVGPTLDGLTEVVHRQRATVKPPVLIRGEARPVDRCGFGELRWYMHPAMPGYGRTAPMLLFTQALGEGDATVPLHSPGNGFVYVLEGEVEVTIDGDIHMLAPGDMALVPPRRDGVVLSMRAPRGEARSLLALANLWSLGGVGLGADFALTEHGPV
jgi:quercetin dioxygenase-like cupin family protein